MLHTYITYINISEMIISMGMESWWPKFISLSCLSLPLLIAATHCFSFVRTVGHVDECSALLQLKQSFSIDEFASWKPLSCAKVASWTQHGGERSNCCSWDGVECDEESGHVIGLDLSSSCLRGSLSSNSSLFQLVHLHRLDLSDNHFHLSEIPSTLGHDLTSLTYLNLSMSAFSGQIPSEMSKLSKLSTLDLSFNALKLTKANMIRSLVQNLTNIERLHLSRVDIYSTLPDILVNASSLTSLKLDGCGLYGEFPVGIFHLPSLEVLDLSFNALKLTKANMIRSLVQNLTNIERLHLSRVDIYSTLPDILVNASSLTSLKLEGCRLYGEFPVGIFHLPSLEVLDVSNNSHLTGYFPTFNKSNNSLKKLDVANTNFSGQLPTTIGNLHSLNLFDISYCNFSPLVPSSLLRNLTQLSYLRMSSFSTGQVIASWSWVGKLTKLYELSLSNTAIKGEFPSFLSNLTQLEYLELTQNEISGQLPSWLMKLTKLTALYLGGNNLQGEIPGWLFQLKNLQYLDLSYNNLSGLVEFDHFSKLTKLKLLRLSHNKLSVQIKTDLSAGFPKLSVLRLGFCNLTEFPEFLKNQYELDELDLSDNNIHGQIPQWMWNATRESLFYLNLSNNFLTGFEQNPGIVPWQNLLFLILGFNRLQGSVPTPPQSIKVYDASNNEYTGEISPSFCNLNNLGDLDLSNNNISGKLPRCFGKSAGFETLKLRNNSIRGDVPPICSKGNDLVYVDLSHNQLQGKVPRSMANCTRLEFLNIGNNQITDVFPSWLGALPSLWGLILRSNGFHGMIGKPATNHEFRNLCIIDLSNNRFSGTLPSNYLENWNCMKSVDKHNQTYFEAHSSVRLNEIQLLWDNQFSMTTFGKGVELDYERIPYNLKLIDLSRNGFEGEIPAGIIGNLRGLRLVNLSKNALTGHIPPSLANLTALESLDLSQNQLSGNIPSNLAQLNFLAYFNVSHNHLWGAIPHGQQFDTFQEGSYQGNSGLCGKPLPKKCESSISPPPSIFEEDEDSGFQIALDWYVVLPGVVSGLIVGVVAGNFWTSKNHEWFVEMFSRKRQPRGTRGRRGHRN